MFNYSIKISNSKNKIGFINFIYNEKNNKIYISYLNIFNQYRNKGYGTLLILISLNQIINNIYNSYFIKEIKLDDCSERSGQKDSIYYKLGFRNYNPKNKEELFVKFFNKNKYNDELKLKTIYDLYDYIYNSNYYKLNKLNFNSLSFKIVIYNNNNNEIIKNKFKFKFNLNKKIIKNLKITRGRKNI